jgi:hypothetical protein
MTVVAYRHLFTIGNYSFEQLTLRLSNRVRIWSRAAFAHIVFLVQRYDVFIQLPASLHHLSTLFTRTLHHLHAPYWHYQNAAKRTWCRDCPIKRVNVCRIKKVLCMQLQPKARTPLHTYVLHTNKSPVSPHGAPIWCTCSTMALHLFVSVLRYASRWTSLHKALMRLIADFIGACILNWPNAHCGNCVMWYDKLITKHLFMLPSHVGCSARFAIQGVHTTVGT